MPEIPMIQRKAMPRPETIKENIILGKVKFNSGNKNRQQGAKSEKRESQTQTGSHMQLRDRGSFGFSQDVGLSDFRIPAVSVHTDVLVLQSMPMLWGVDNGILLARVRVVLIVTSNQIPFTTALHCSCHSNTDQIVRIPKQNSGAEDHNRTNCFPMES